MKLDLPVLVALGALAGACASKTRTLAGDDARSAETGSEPRNEARPAVGMQGDENESAPHALDLSLERMLVDEARAAVKAVDFAAARAKASEAIALLLARSEGKSDGNWLRLLNEAGLAAWDAHDEHAARAAWEVVLEVRSLTLPDNDPALQAARLSLAAAIYTVGDLARARALQEKVLEVASLTLPDDHPDLQVARENLAHIIMELGDLAVARELFEKVLEIRSLTLHDNHPDLQGSRANLAAALLCLGDPEGARALLERVLVVWSRTPPHDHLDVQRVRRDLAHTLRTLGDLAGARTLQESVLEVFSRTLPDDHPDLQSMRLGLADTLRMLGDFARARTLEESVLEIYSRTLPDDHPRLQAARSSFANTLKMLGDLAGARVLQEKVLEVLSRSLAEDHLDHQGARLNLATTLEELGDVASARMLQESALEVYSSLLPEDHIDLQRARLGLAATFRKLGDLAGARALDETVLEVFSRTLPDDHPDLQAVRANLAVMIAAERAAEAGKGVEGGLEGGREREMFTRLAGSFTRAVARSASVAILTRSSREAEERCASVDQHLGRALSFAEGLGVFDIDAGLEREAFVLSEESRGAALTSARLSRRASSDPRYVELRERMSLASDELARLAQGGAGADELDAARARSEAAERELVWLARELSGGQAGLLELDPAALFGLLSEREALVGYRRYVRWMHELGGGIEPESTESLCAFVLRSGDRLERVELGPIEPIERAVERWREGIGTRLERGVGVTADQLNESLRSGEELRRLVFEPLTAPLEGAERLVVALDDVLHVVPLDALPMPDVAGGMTLLGERWRIETRCTLSELPWKEPALVHGEALFALGGASFNLAPLPLSAEESAALDDEHTGPPQVASLLRGGAWERGFEPLTYSGPEVRGIAALYGEAFEESLPALVLEKRKASRAALVELASKARFLHIATHGWFAPESVRSMADPEPLDAKLGFGVRMSGEERVRGMSPMLLCGLALAGANLPEDELGRAPGLVTAEELSTLDLSGCELAVLSACDTNVGERRAGQGVASLQKALHMAGARTVITSLWKVPDEATRELMLDFYRRIWIEKKPKAQALWEAKMKIRNAKDERGRPLYTTRDWAAWVLTGDPD